MDPCIQFNPMKASAAPAIDRSVLPCANDSSPSAPGIDLGAVRPIRAVLSAGGFPAVIQAGLLLVCVALAVLAWGVHAPAGVNAKLFAKSNLVTLVIWGLWWPAMVWAAVLLGRTWCMVCPLEFLGRVTEKLGRRLGLAGRPLPRWLAGGGIIVTIFIVLQLLVPGVQLHRTPAYTAVFLTTMLGLVIVAALLFQHRAFCRGFCPAGLFLGTYGRGGLLAVRPGPPGAPPAPDARTCPTLLNPSGLDHSRDCLMCCHCVKASPPGAMRLLLRPPYCGTDARPQLASWPVTIFVMVTSGFVTSELCTEWAAAQAVFLRVPKAAAALLQAPGAASWLEAVWTVFIVPLVMWLVLAGLLRLAGRKERLGDLWRSIALPMALLVAAGHMAKGLAKFVSWLPFLPQAVNEPVGAATALAITGRTLAAPKSLVALSSVGIVALGLILAAFFLALREQRLTRRDLPGIGAVLPYGMVAAFFGAIVAGWTIQ